MPTTRFGGFKVNFWLKDPLVIKKALLQKLIKDMELKRIDEHAESPSLMR